MAQKSYDKNQGCLTWCMLTKDSECLLIESVVFWLACGTGIRQNLFVEDSGKQIVREGRAVHNFVGYPLGIYLVVFGHKLYMKNWYGVWCSFQISRELGP